MLPWLWLAVMEFALMPADWKRNATKSKGRAAYLCKSKETVATHTHTPCGSINSKAVFFGRRENRLLSFPGGFAAFYQATHSDTFHAHVVARYYTRAVTTICYLISFRLSSFFFYFGSFSRRGGVPCGKRNETKNSVMGPVVCGML